MGDMADMIIDDIMLAHWDNGGPDFEQPLKRCKYCGEDGLHWREDGYGKWRLFDDRNNMHSCVSNKQNDA